MPLATLVSPVKVLLPLSTHLPEPDLVSEVAPVLLAITGVKVLFPAFEPVKKSVRAAVLVVALRWDGSNSVPAVAGVWLRGDQVV